MATAKFKSNTNTVIEFSIPVKLTLDSASVLSLIELWFVVIENIYDEHTRKQRAAASKRGPGIRKSAGLTANVPFWSGTISKLVPLVDEVDGEPKYGRSRIVYAIDTMTSFNHVVGRDLSPEIATQLSKFLLQILRDQDLVQSSKGSEPAVTSVNDLEEFAQGMKLALDYGFPEQDLGYSLAWHVMRVDKSHPSVAAFNEALKLIAPIVDTLSAVLPSALEKAKRISKAKADEKQSQQIAEACDFLTNVGYTVSKPETTKKGKSK